MQDTHLGARLDDEIIKFQFNETQKEENVREPEQPITEEGADKDRKYN